VCTLFAQYFILLPLSSPLSPSPIIL
jgi:hypothetical protein